MDERLTPVELSDRLVRQSVAEAELATRRMIELTSQVVALTEENAQLRAQLRDRPGSGA